jgi:hypothetical protein
MSVDAYDAMIGAIRAEDGEDPELAVATHLRLRRSLETRARGRHQLAGLMTAIAILLVGTVSWALATGRISTLWAPAPRLRVSAAEVTPPAPPPRAPARRAIASAPAPALPPESPPPVTAPEPPPPALPSAPAPARARPRPSPASPASPAAPVVQAAAQPVEVLYRRAHELHFHAGDAAATLAAWDAYLAAEPDGRFSVDARYNRAIILIRIGRYADARAALAPFARGEVVPAGYRQAEAEQLVERLARYE